MKKQATNQFIDGLVTDFHPLTAKNTTLTNALNATLVTVKGNEMVLQNDVGNIKIQYTEDNEQKFVQLSEGFIPLGIKEYGGIIYIVSYHLPSAEYPNGAGEIGSFPSPAEKRAIKIAKMAETESTEYWQYEIDAQTGPLVNKYSPFKNLITTNFITDPLKRKDIKQVSNLPDASDCLSDFRTEKFNFDLLHPVTIETQASYDGSVNLILTDDKNPPRLINSGFSVLENGQVEIPNRRNNYDNIYTEEHFELETSLVKKTDKFPKITYNGVINSGDLKVGNYTLYLKYSDDDGNETDFIAQSGMISIFKGNDADPFSIDGGVEDMNANKSISIRIDNIDNSYNNIKVYFTRTSSAIDSNRIPQAYVINKPFNIQNPYNRINGIIDSDLTNSTELLITGDEDITQIALSEIVTQYFIADKAKTEAQCQNILFLGNVETTEVDYTNLANASQRIYPEGIRTKSREKIGWVEPRTYQDSSDLSITGANHNYSFEYYNTRNIYYNVGYWNEEFYRLGIVYILKDNTKTPVFNIMGGVLTNKDVESPDQFDQLVLKGYQEPSTIGENDCTVPPINDVELNPDYIDNNTYLNVRGVIRISDTKDISTVLEDEQTYYNDTKSYIYGIKINIPEDVISYLKRQGIKGYMIVRYKRIPTIACQGYTLPWDKEAKIPIITYYGPKRIGTLDPTKALPEGNLRLDSKFEYLYCKKRRYFVESFLKQVGQEGFKEDDKNELYPSKVDNTYYSRLHYILDYMIDTKLTDVSFEGKKHFLTSSYIVPYNSIYTIFNTNSSYLDQEYILIYGQEAMDGVLSKINMMYSGDSMDSKVEAAAQNGSPIVLSNGQILFFDYESARRQYLTTGTSNRDIFVFSGFDYCEDFLQRASQCGVDNTPGGGNPGNASRWRIMPDGDFLDPQDPDPDLDASYEESFYYAYYYDHYSDQEVPAGSGTASTEDEAVEALNAVIETMADNTILHYSIVRKLTNTKQPNPDTNTYTLAFLGNDGWSTTTNAIGTKASELPLWDLKGYIGRTNVTVNNYGNLRITSVDDYSFSEDDTDTQIQGYFLNWKFVNEGATYNVPTYVIQHYYSLYKYCNGRQLTAICPEFEVRQPYFNTLFTGAKYKVKYTNYQPGYLLNDSNTRKFYVGGTTDTNARLKYDSSLRDFNIVSVTDNVPVVAVNNTIFKSVIGSDMEAYRFAYINEEHCAYRKCGATKYRNHYEHQDFNLVRGIYSPYLGIDSSNYEFVSDCGFDDDAISYKGTYNQCKLFNIYYPGTFKNDNSLNQDVLFSNRFKDYSGYYPISDITELIENQESDTLYRGDCFLCTFTHRVNRNFNDPTSPTNDHIVDPKTWRNNYDPANTRKEESDDVEIGVEKLNQINRGDINAVKLGSWITIKLRASYNLSIRSLDESHLQEKGIIGRARGFYPLQQASADGGFKIPNSYVINDAFGATLGEQFYAGIQDVPYINTNYADRIIYSDIDVTGAFKNGYRIFKGTTLKDYTKQYGAIIKLIERAGDLVCIFEHGTALLKINEKAIGAESNGGLAYITANTVLPETPFVYSDMYGSQWAESVIKTPSGIIYGIDTVRKKIWKLSNKFEIISDFRIEKFLNDNLTFTETDIIPYLGIKNVATHYNANKSDVMFTFYYKQITIESIKDHCGKITGYELKHTVSPETGEDTTFGENEIAWNICYNEILDKFQTFYSWIPIASANIDNQFYSFDRQCSREILTNQEQSEDYWPSSPDRESPKHQIPNKVPYLWKHGEHNNVRPLPTNWYGEQHPFEFEFIVNEEVGVQKIFNNLVIISNKAEPESFHFTITGDSYEFSADKPTMYYRQEATKELFNNLHSKITYDTLYKEIKPQKSSKSTILPLYYNRVNHYNDIYDIYTKMLDRTGSRDYSELSGAEIIWDKTLNEFNLTVHIKNQPLDQYGTLRGNSRYLEDRWDIQIPSFNLMQKNEQWASDVPPIVINPNIYATDITNTVIDHTGLPNTYSMGDIDTTGWTFRKQAKLRDKYCKIKIRYSGTKLAVISAIITTFTISYA